jgi:hypothetical protein
MPEDNGSNSGASVVTDAVESDSSARAPELVRLFLRQIDTASAYIAKLCQATSRGDLAAALAASLSLSQAWGRAKTAIFVLERESQSIEVFARDALQHSFDAARDPLAQAWELIYPDEQWSSGGQTAEGIQHPQGASTSHRTARGQ